MNIHMSTVVTSVASFAAGVAVKTLLDFGLAPFIVKYFWWFPVRTIFRKDDIKIAGLWEQKWEAVSTTFAHSDDRHGNIIVKQFGSYCYGEFTSKGRKYCVFGRIENSFFIGNWYAARDKLGYFGVFHLQIIDSDIIEGLWMGHSKKRSEIKQGPWKWRKVE